MALSQAFYDYLQELEARSPTGTLSAYSVDSEEIFRLQVLAEPEGISEKQERARIRKKKEAWKKKKVFRVDTFILSKKQEEIGLTGKDIDRLAGKYEGWFTRIKRRGTAKTDTIEELAEVLELDKNDILERIR